MVDINKILFPTDFSETSKKAFKYAVEFANVFNAELEILHIQLDEAQVVAFYLPESTLRNVKKELEESTKQQLDDFCNIYRHQLEKVNYYKKILKGIPHVEIIEEAKETNADMIIIGTHGRSGFEHVLFGSTTEKVIRKAPCPVLTVSLRGLELKNK
ncbi:MAG: universal stress protein [Deferribacterota bacterium]|nr:universal stress protein [Deferribacterota bacterium]